MSSTHQNGERRSSGNGASTGLAVAAGQTPAQSAGTGEPLAMLSGRLRLALLGLRRSLAAGLQTSRAAGPAAQPARVAIHRFHQAGFTSAELQQLIDAGLATLVPPPRGMDTGRRRSCYITALHLALTDSGAWAAVPRWDPRRRELSFGGLLVMHFRHPAPNQERILAALQDRGWPDRIDDPLPPAANLDPARRLHETIERLNGHQQNSLIEFRGDGSRRSIFWRPLDASDCA